jgi:MEMO1 family protein
MANNIRQPAVAGRFYPMDAKQLAQEVQQYIEQSGVEPAEGAVASVVGPHAGFRYSGPTAGAAYARVRGSAPSRVVLLGCSHYMPIERAAIAATGAFAIPGAIFPIDEAFAAALIAEWGNESTEAHIPEHSLETHLPFLNAAVGEVPIVPVLFGAPTSEWHRQAGATLAAMLNPGDLVACSTDLSHYLTEDEANAIDKRSLDTVLDGDVAHLVQGVASGTCAMCGATAVCTTMVQARERGANDWRLLDYRTSGRASGDYQRVVGYGAISMERAA